MFEKCVRELIKSVKNQHMIERFVKMAKCHWNIANQDKAFIKKAWKEAQMNCVKDWCS